MSQLAWIYNEAPNRDSVVVNDRWGSDNPPIGSGKHHGGYFSGGDRQQANPAMLKVLVNRARLTAAAVSTVAAAAAVAAAVVAAAAAAVAAAAAAASAAAATSTCTCAPLIGALSTVMLTTALHCTAPQHKWENAFTIDSASWGYARDDGISSYLNITTLLYEIVSTVSYGGNVLINVGPTADGRIATIFQERLLQMGSWLKINGEAIYETRQVNRRAQCDCNAIPEPSFHTTT